MSPRCPACDTASTKRAFRDPSSSFLRCRTCRTVFATDVPDRDEIARLYEGREYFIKDESSDNDAGYADDYLADAEESTAKFDGVLAHLERMQPPGRLLDVGAGPGLLVAAAQRRGWHASGLDLNEWAVAYGRDELGLDMHLGPLTAESFDGEQFDAITMMDVVEHVPHPDELLAEAARLVRPGGTLALLTPDAGALPSRMLGARWPEVRRPGEHMVLFSVAGLAAALARHGFVATGWHTVGKTASVETLLADVSSAAPGVVSPVRRAVAGRAVGQRVIDLDPRTKFCLYARRAPAGARRPRHLPPRVPKKAEDQAGVEEAILDELQTLADARRLCDWLFDQFGAFAAGGRVLEVGAGIGTFTQRMLDAGATSVLALEPEESCADALDRRFDGEDRVEVTRDSLPDSPRVSAEQGAFDLVVCQNVLEHIADDQGSIDAMAAALRPGGRLVLIVPASARLYGSLDHAYGHWRRYHRDDVRDVMTKAGLQIEDLRPMNALGILGWWTKNLRPGARVGASSLKMYEALVSVWRPVEDRLGVPVGLSLVGVARKPD